MGEIHDLESMRQAVKAVAEAERVQYANNTENSQDANVKIEVGQELTDLGNSGRLISRHGQDLLYCYPWNFWLVWDGRRWLKDETGEIERRAAETIRDTLTEAIKAQREAEAAGNENRSKGLKELISHALASQAKPRLQAMIHLARMQVPVLPADLDADPWLFNVQNGTLDLRTSKLRPHKRADKLTKLAPVEYDPAAKCPTFDRFILEIMDNRPELVSYLARVFGYALTGNISEQCFFLFYGRGANGKSTLLEAMRALLGDYASQAEFQTFLDRRADQGINNDIAALRGARLVTASEANAGRRLNESMIKQVTGGDPVTARFLYAEFFSYLPTFKLVLATNHKPRIRGVDHAIWRRVRLVPFDVQIPADRQDPTLLDQLKAELPGILNWTLQGLADCRAHGLNEPSPVNEATNQYRESSDELGPFLADCCVVHEQAQVSGGKLRQAYLEWCEANGQDAVGPKIFAALLEDRGFKRNRTKQKRLWQGIGLLAGNEEVPASG